MPILIGILKISELTFAEQTNVSIFATTYLPRFPLEQRAQGKFFLFIGMASPIYNQPQISVDEQILLLKSEGLSFEDESRAYHLFQNISMFRLKSYLDLSDNATAASSKLA